ncbi:MAG: hypothetical protein K8R68_07995 [Bacteroidales bacterium]|nr:hypothetical protein [Bacteroidales bacterium]
MKTFILLKNKVKAYPNLSSLLYSINTLIKEIRFIFHALYTGKYFIKYNRRRVAPFLSKQKIITYELSDSAFITVDDFLKWLKNKCVEYIDSRWTIYIPPQKGISNTFSFLKNNHPVDSGLKILKDFRHPDKALYTHPKLRKKYGSILKRLMTHSPVSLVRVANYLYDHKIGIRVYDLVALKGNNICLTCYVVKHIQGPTVQTDGYNLFIKNIKKFLKSGDITTVGETVENLKDFRPPNCNDNLFIDAKEGRATYVDFQGFLLLNENKIIDNIINETEGKFHPGTVRSNKNGKKYVFEQIPGLYVGKTNLKNNENIFYQMLEECECSFENRVVFDIGCNTGLRLYNAISKGAIWGFGWDLPDVVAHSRKLLLALGATRFDLFSKNISSNTDFTFDVPKRFMEKKDGILFLLNSEDQIELKDGVKKMPWEFLFYEGSAFSRPEWAEVVSHRYVVLSTGQEKEVILLRRSE